MAMVGVDAPFQNIVVGARAGAGRAGRHPLPQADGSDDDGRSDAEPRWSRCATSRSPSAASRPWITSASISIPGEVVGLLGHNGAGKSTLIKCLSGAYRQDSGEIFVNGEKAEINNPARCAPLQHRDDLPDAGAGRQSRRPVQPVPRARADDAGWASSTTPRWRPRRAGSWGGSTRTSSKFAAPVSALSGGQRQSVAIARAVYFNAKILIMDEPTAALGPQETQMVAELIQELKKDGPRHLPDRSRRAPGEAAVRPRRGDEERRTGGHRGGRGRDRRTTSWP